MTGYNTTLESKVNKLVGDSGENSEIFDLFDAESEIFTIAKPREKEGNKKGWLDDLRTAEKARVLSERPWNIGIALGREVSDGYTVVFDKEAGGKLPEDSREILEREARAIWQSPHGGRNYLLIVSERTLNTLQSLKEKVYITDGEAHDLEILTSKHALIPPSEINHAKCSPSKPCDGEGIGRYQVDSIRSEGLCGVQTINRILAPLPVENKSKHTQKPQDGERQGNGEVDLPELPENFDIDSYCEEHLPGTESFNERLTYVIHNIERVNELWFTEPEDRSENELALRRELAWYFNADSKVIQYIFEEILPNFRQKGLKYHENKYHARDVLEFQEYVSRPYYTTGISFNFREQLSLRFLEEKEIAAEELYGDKIFNTRGGFESYSKKHIQRGLLIFEKLGLIEHIGENLYKNIDIDQEYIEELNKLNDCGEYIPTKHPYDE